LVSLGGCADRSEARRETPFALGVASGYPRPTEIVLWTRLLLGSADAERPAPALRVVWEVAEDPRFDHIVRRGEALATADWAHSVHAEVDGLRPARDYWYRFLALGHASPTGHTRTAPASNAPAGRLRLAYASCQNYEQGWFTAHRHMAAEDLDLVAFLGDYIYESSWGSTHVRKHGAGEPETLAAYRARHALYRSDPDLQACHAAHPWVVTWDDHEVENDYAGDRSQGLWPRVRFLARREAAYRAFYEHMPLPGTMRPRGPDMPIHTRLDWGQLARMYVLDGRQYRSHQVCPRPGRGGSAMVGAECVARIDPALTLLGPAQEAWLDAEMASSRGAWNLLLQQTLFAQLLRRSSGGEARFWTDGWDGYTSARQRLIDMLIGRRVANPLIIGGDVHATYAADIHADPVNHRGPVIASEICGTSITSQGPAHARLEALAADNPHLRFANGAARGYVTMDLAPRGAQAALRIVETVKAPHAGIRTLVRFDIEAGRPGVQTVQS